MNCAEFQLQLETAVELRSPPADIVRLHGETCAAEVCRKNWQQYVLLDRAIQRWKANIPSVNLQGRIQQDVQNTNRHRPLLSHGQADFRTRQSQHSRFPAIAAAFSGVAVLLLALVVNFETEPHPGALTTHPVLEPGKTLPLADSPSLVSASEDTPAPLRDISVQCVDWMEGATYRVTDAVTYVMSPVRSTVDQMPPMDTPALWLKRWEERWEPLEKSLDKTWQELLRESQSTSTTGRDQPT